MGSGETGADVTGAGEAGVSGAAPNATASTLTGAQDASLHATAAPQVLHASCVAHAGRALLILGPSGAGKSALALRLLALGARLVADDQTELWPESGGLTARCPPALRGLIEARGIGLLRVSPLDAARVALVADLAQPEPDRLPPHRQITLLGCTLPLVLRPRNDHLAEALLMYLAGGRQD